jgi:XTP/dITP diphosphohydrolase
MTIVFASGNIHKKGEIDQILSEHTIMLPAEIGIDFEYEETGLTFYENARGKADHLFSLSGKPSLSDDSGLCVAALNGEPGIMSARYGAAKQGQNLSNAERNEFLLSQMKGIANRKAFFVCCMVLVFEEHRFAVVQEILEGEITLTPLGSEGFGYDPLFFLPNLGKTAAQLSTKEKNKISHRGRAAERIAKLIQDLD